MDLARVSPLMHAHVIPNGAYRFPDEEELERMYATASECITLVVERPADCIDPLRALNFQQGRLSRTDRQEKRGDMMS